MTYRVTKTETYSTPRGLIAVNVSICDNSDLAAGRSGVVHFVLGDGRLGWLYVADRATGRRNVAVASVMNRNGRWTALTGAWLEAAEDVAERYADRLWAA